MACGASSPSGKSYHVRRLLFALCSHFPTTLLFEATRELAIHAERILSLTNVSLALARLLSSYLTMLCSPSPNSTSTRIWKQAGLGYYASSSAGTIRRVLAAGLQCAIHADPTLQSLAVPIISPPHLLTSWLVPKGKFGLLREGHWKRAWKVVETKLRYSSGPKRTVEFEILNVSTERWLERFSNLSLNKAGPQYSFLRPV